MPNVHTVTIQTRACILCTRHMRVYVVIRQIVLRKWPSRAQLGHDVILAGWYRSSSAALALKSVFLPPLRKTVFARHYKLTIRARLALTNSTRKYRRVHASTYTSNLQCLICSSVCTCARFLIDSTSVYIFLSGCLDFTLWVWHIFHHTLSRSL